MTVQALNAQALRPAVSFKKSEAEAEAAVETKEAPVKENKHIAAKVIGGASALALLGFGVYKLAKGKGAGNSVKKQFEKLYPEYRNIQHKYEGDKIVENFQKMRPLEDTKTYAKIRQELTHMDWDATPIKRADLAKGVAANKLKEAQEVADLAEKIAKEAQGAASNANGSKGSNYIRQASIDAVKKADEAKAAAAATATASTAAKEGTAAETVAKKTAAKPNVKKTAAKKTAKKTAETTEQTAAKKTAAKPRKKAAKKTAEEPKA